MTSKGTRHQLVRGKQDDIEMTPVDGPPNTRCYSSGSSGSSGSEMGPPLKSGEESADSGTSSTYNPTFPAKNDVHPDSVFSIDMATPQTKKLTIADEPFRRPPSAVNSIADASLEMTEEEKVNSTRWDMIRIYSCIYALILTVSGGIIFLSYQSEEKRFKSEMFSICISVTGMMWLIYFHIDLFRYKLQVTKRMMSTYEQADKISTDTDYNFVLSFLGTEPPPYRFLMGRHSGSFYLKIGMAAFCFGHLIKEGLLLGQQAINYIQEDRYLKGCGDPFALTAHIVRPIYSFYQLFIVFKYSNIVINRHKYLASFALMHITATCVCYWFGTIVEEALEEYHYKLGKKEQYFENGTVHYTSDHAICSHDKNSTWCECVAGEILSINSVHAIPYLYPFTIEFNLLLAGVWFVVWHNIGKDHHKANPHHFQHKVHRNDGIEEVIFQSNLVISADCHASNKGLFAGLLLLLASVISIVIFFVAMSTKQTHHLGISIHYVQDGTLTTLALCGVIIAYRQLSKLDFNKHPITFLDDVLLFLPLPFFFIQALLIIMSEYHKGNTVRIVVSLLLPIQVILQTPLIIAGLRRCSNSQALRYKKPGREIVTFLIVCNLTMWIINTFEAKSVESHYGQSVYFGQFLWLFVSHTTLPLMLFYRFHSSVCLADIWKSAYEKGE